MVFETLDHVFQHDWREVALASFKKYPNPQRPEVESVDLLKREFDEKTGVLKQTKLVILRRPLPAWLQKILCLDNRVYMLEESTIDPAKHFMTLKTRNLCYSQVLEWEETCTYTKNHQNPNWTSFKHDANFTAFPYGVKSAIERFVSQSFRNDAAKGRDIMEQVILKIKQETWESLARGAEEVGTMFMNEAEESLEKTKVVIEDLVKHTPVIEPSISIK